MNPTAPAAPAIDLTDVSADRLAAMPDSVLRRALLRAAAERADAQAGTVASFNSAVVAA
jgi:FXSXX-COOH protein